MNEELLSYHELEFCYLLIAALLIARLLILPAKSTPSLGKETKEGKNLNVLLSSFTPLFL